MRADLSIRPKCSHRCVFLKESSLNARKSSSTRPEHQPSKPLREQNGVNISRMNLFRSISNRIKITYKLSSFCKIVLQPDYTFRDAEKSRGNCHFGGLCFLTVHQWQLHLHSRYSLFAITYLPKLYLSE